MTPEQHARFAWLVRYVEYLRECRHQERALAEKPMLLKKQAG